jgi:hypothetical protein
MEQEINRWYKILWETKGSRFVAANRLELHEKWSTISASLFSVYIISLNLLVLFPESKRLPYYNNLNITYTTICLSVLILAVSLIITSMNYKLRADKFHECGRRIDDIYNKVCIWKNTGNYPSNYELERTSSEYLNILDKYENHTRIDYLLFKANNLMEYNIKHKNIFWIKTKSLFYIQTIGIYLFATIIPLILLFIN